MGLFNFSKKDSDNKIKLIAPVSGTTVNLSEVPDAVFSQKIVGDGIAFNPTGNVIVAPCAGIINKIFKTNHAFSMLTDGGIELFVHFGIDTVELKGQGFTRIANEDQRVSVGDHIISFDLDFLSREARSVVTPMIISNMNQVVSMSSEVNNKQVEAGESIVLTIQMNLNKE